MKALFLKKGRENSLLRRHPWIFSGAVQTIGGNPGMGETVEVFSANRKWVARAAFSPKSQIIGRVWTFDEEQEINRGFFIDRLARALNYRKALGIPENNTAYRLCFAESDGIPGMVADRYGDWLVMQFLAAGAEHWRDDIIQAVRELLPGVSVMDRSDAEVRQKEGLDKRVEVVHGSAPEGLIETREGPAVFMVDLLQGHKTGSYLDQRDNRALLQQYCSGKEVLNCFSYTGGFGIFALHGGAAQVVNMDTSAEALDLAALNYKANGFTPDESGFQVADVFKSLRKFRDRGQQFDVIVLDPPKFVTSASQMAGGTRGYKDINLLAMKLLRPGGILFTFSCSGLVGLDLFKKIIADAARDAGRDVNILHHLFQATDHPVSTFFPEGLYLKGLACSVF